MVSISILKKHLKLLLLIIFPLVIFCLIKIFFPPKVLIIDQENIHLSPVRLLIPAVNVSANVQSLGINQSGEMETPSNIVDVGWFNLGSKPGEKGSAVIAGHFNGKNNQEGVFANLDKLDVGDKLFVEDEMGKLITFIIKNKKIYDSGYAEEVFSKNDGIYLNLITCDGLWDKAKNSYTKRLVIFSEIVSF